MAPKHLLSWLKSLIALAVAWAALGSYRFQILGNQPDGRLLDKAGRNRSQAPVTLLPSDRKVLRARSIGRTVERAAARTPWNSNCYVQALAASCLLRRLGVPYSLFLGVAVGAETQQFEAHAWVSSGPATVSGGAATDRFSIIACYTWDPTYTPCSAHSEI